MPCPCPSLRGTNEEVERRHDTYKAEQGRIDQERRRRGRRRGYTVSGASTARVLLGSAVSSTMFCVAVAGRRLVFDLFLACGMFYVWQASLCALALVSFLSCPIYLPAFARVRQSKWLAGFNMYLCTLPFLSPTKQHFHTCRCSMPCASGQPAWPLPLLCSRHFQQRPRGDPPRRSECQQRGRVGLYILLLSPSLTRTLSTVMTGGE